MSAAAGASMCLSQTAAEGEISKILWLSCFIFFFFLSSSLPYFLSFFLPSFYSGNGQNGITVGQRAWSCLVIHHSASD